jgi:single-stranded DNA-binding protein
LTQLPVTIKGRVIKPVEFSVTPTKGTPLCKFDIGVAGIHPQLNIPTVTTIHIVTWNDLADNVGQYVAVDDELELTGRFETRPYTSSSGQQREWTEFVAFEVKRGDVALNNDGFKRSETSFLPPDEISSEPSLALAPPEITDATES